MVEACPPLVDFNQIDLPVEGITRRVIAVFFACGGTLFYIMPSEACEDIIRAVYKRRNDVTKMMVCQLCALASVGSQYSPAEIPASAKEQYFQCAFWLLNDPTVQGDPRVMRVYACLAMYLILLKSTRARSMTRTFSIQGTLLTRTVSGLNIARRMQVSTPEDETEWLDRARVLRTLVFLEW